MNLPFTQNYKQSQLKQQGAAFMSYADDSNSYPTTYYVWYNNLVPYLGVSRLGPGGFITSSDQFCEILKCPVCQYGNLYVGTLYRPNNIYSMSYGYSYEVFGSYATFGWRPIPKYKYPTNTIVIADSGGPHSYGATPEGYVVNGSGYSIATRHGSNGANALFLDGHAVWQPMLELKRLMQTIDYR